MDAEAKQIYYSFFDTLISKYSDSYVAQHLAIVYVDQNGHSHLYPTSNLKDYSEFNLESEEEDDEDYEPKTEEEHVAELAYGLGLTDDDEEDDEDYEPKSQESSSQETEIVVEEGSSPHETKKRRCFSCIRK